MLVYDQKHHMSKFKVELIVLTNYFKTVTQVTNEAYGSVILKGISMHF